MIKHIDIEKTLLVRIMTKPSTRSKDVSGAGPSETTSKYKTPATTIVTNSVIIRISTINLEKTYSIILHVCMKHLSIR